MAPKQKIPICIPNISGNELANLTECIETKFISSVGQFVNDFEDDLCKLTHFKHACAVTSGTSALSLALHNAGVGPNELVIIPDYTFIATANAVRHCGASPWLFDIKSSDLNLDIVSVRTALQKDCYQKEGMVYHKASNKRISAIVPVFALGNAIDFQELDDLYKDFNIPIIIDAAGALGVKFKDLELGSLNLTSIVISFNGNKTFTCGGGGAILTNNTDFFSLCKHTSTTARSGYEYIHDQVGFNHRMTNLQAAVGCAQLDRYNEFVEKKQKIYSHYIQNFKYLKNVSFHQNIYSSRWISYFILNQDIEFNLDKLYENSQTHGIDLRPFWVPMHMQPPYSESIKTDLHVSQGIYSRVCTLPSSTNITQEELNIVTDTLNNFFSTHT
ncbi:aminotransferase class I/II-fold pyridoxal phosphate-dependent enzyme [Gammaproteobacteria bacterium]|nr:aminotransferase class I/II-fold pyridoxal phosphate-dependent enzyme [Gammaproteobacteria bacterium]